MKTGHKYPNIIKLFAIIQIAIILLIINPIISSAQNGDPPPPPGEHGQNGNQPPGGGAPIGSGLVILIALGATYSGKKLYGYKKRKLAE